jgi:surface polysaccharide O-acyltransferase-like enzyme
MALAQQPPIQTPTTHIYWIDLVRVFAVFQVVLVHLSYVIFFKEDPLTYNWQAANFYDSFSRMGVPLFFMVSGYLLLRKDEPVVDFFRKRFMKVGIPTLFWSVAYLLWSVKAYTDGSMNPLSVILSMLKAIYTGNVEIHLWFLYILIGIYLVVPILRVYVSAASRQNLTYFIVMWFLATPLLELAQRVIGFETALVIPVVAGYVGYFMMGYLLADVELSRQGMILSILGCIIAVAVTYFGTNILSVNAAPIDTYFSSYFSPPTVLASICGFLLLKNLGQKLGGAGRTVRLVSATSFGIYLIHIFVVELLRQGELGFHLYSWMAPSVYMIPLTALAVFVLSFMIIFVMRKIPALKLLVP